MAPVEDDFVLTISDDDNDPQASEPEDLDIEAATQPLKRGKKRKHAHDDDSTSPANAVGKKSNPSKKTQSKQKTYSIPAEGPQDDSELHHGLDDGTMDPNFEFQVEDFGAGIVEDFDGWATNGAGLQTAIGGNKRAVDIDDIIARRRHGERGAAEERSIGDDEALLDDGTEAESEGESENDGVEGSEDEFLALDGFGMGAAAEDEDQDEDEDENENENENENEDDHEQRDQGSVDEVLEGDSEDDLRASPVAHPDDLASNALSLPEDQEDPAEVARREAFFAPDEPSDKAPKGARPSTSKSFQTMSLSRPVLKGLAAVGFSEPTPIQSKTIPIALLGKDVVGGAVTGSGKTAAFLVPTLERLLYRPKKVPTSRVAILMPTRELAVQCFNVAKRLAAFTDITFSRLVGGFSLREQESELRMRPDVIIATPGRFIDHMRNSASFTVDTLEILVLDEADRMLEDGFADELNEILTTIPKSRQTMLFSATMTDSVDKLIRLGLTRPARLLVDAKRRTVDTLVQEFVRLRPGREDKRLACLMLLCTTSYMDRVIVFFRQKKEAHRVRVVFGLCHLKATELHGSMSQEQRIHSVEAFREGKVSYLLATDLASRGLDIKGVETVINYEAPQSHEIYLHRVGRTARAGRLGRSCTLAAEPDRKVVKAAVKAGRAQGAKIVGRIVDGAAVDEWATKLEDMDGEIEDVLREEKEEKRLAQAELQVKKGSNILTHEEEIMARPKRTWFESEKEKRRAKLAGKDELNGPTDADGKRKKKGKLSGKEKKKLECRDGRMQGNVWKKGSAERGSKGAKLGPRAKKAKAGKASKKGGKDRVNRP